MASIQKRDNGKWRARYRDEAGKEHARHFPRKVDAQRWLDEVTASQVAGTYVDPRAGLVKVADYAAAWESNRVNRAGTLQIIDNALRVHVLPELGEYPIKAVRPMHVEAFVKRLVDKGLAPGTIRNIYDVLARVFSSAVRDRLIAFSPCIDVALPPGTRTEVVPPTLDEIQAVCDELDERWRPIVVILAGSGLRIGELLGLNVFDVDYLRRTIDVSKQRLQSNEIAPTKSSVSRVVPIGQVVLDAIARLEHNGDGPLLLDEFGKPLSYRRWKQILKDATSRAGVDFTSHDLRHYCASVALSGGASIVQVQKLLGHGSANITLRTYAHLVPGDEDRTRNALDAALSSADWLRTGAASS
ncbi:tyrosine-type recombinase/integrase [Nocardioides jishulii]|uniref:Site-specific integrase n=1 Tax=Nocardioides jishulii TaxID=2575440 RepID=A0A4U2YIN0_9ACTN|nr:site-specific integrase [Nocardioides jishulii]QCX28076.1 site-specific integrase [Nocardioides jishulii]TKI60740.1 site-specific integrase [Nocardioides jishulii]